MHLFQLNVHIHMRELSTKNFHLPVNVYTVLTHFFAKLEVNLLLTITMSISSFKIFLCHQPALLLIKKNVSSTSFSLSFHSVCYYKINEMLLICRQRQSNCRGWYIQADTRRNIINVCSI